MFGDYTWACRFSGRQALSPLAFAGAFLAHRAILLYLAIATGALALSIAVEQAWPHLLVALAITLTSYPLVEYGLHRWVMQARFWWRSKLTAGAWRRVHYDHHRDPRDLTVLFAHPAMSVPFLLLVSGVASALAQDVLLLPAMLFWSSAAFIYYEAMHAAAHLGIRTGNRWLARRCRDHLLHHYVDENLHFGIGAGVIDRLAGTATSPGSKNLPSPTVRNLSYDEGRAASFPWVAEGYAQKQSALATINDGPKPFKR